MSGSKSRSSGGDDGLPFKKLFGNRVATFPPGVRPSMFWAKKKKEVKKKKTRGGMKPLKSRTPGR
jgi:hypothetical protein